MQTRRALEQYAGRGVRDWGEGGPFGAIANDLRTAFRAAEDARIRAGEAKAALPGAGPMLAAYQRLLHEAAEASLVDSAVPAVTTYDAWRAVQAQVQNHPKDRGLRMCAVHLRQLCEDAPDSVLAVGDLARLRAHYGRAHPKSVVVDVIDQEIPKVGFNTLPVARIAQAAVDVVDQGTYEAVCHDLGIAGSRPEQKRARAYLRKLVNPNDDGVEHAAATPAVGGTAALNRTVARLLTDRDPLLRRIAQEYAIDTADPTDTADPAALPPDGDVGMPSHDEAAETSATIDSPNTGDPMLLELAPADGEPSDVLPSDALPPAADDGGLAHTAPGDLDALTHMGQLADFEGVPDDVLDGGPDPDMQVDVVDDTQVTTVEDPTAPGQMLEVSVRPASDPDAAVAGSPAGPALPMTTAARTPAARAAAAQVRFAVYAVREGVVGDVPIDYLDARGMPRALCLLNARVAAVNADAALAAEVRADAHRFADQCLVVIDRPTGEYLYVTRTAADGAGGIDWTPGINPQQPNDAVKVPEDGAAALAADGFGPSNGSGYKTGAAAAGAAVDAVATARHVASLQALQLEADLLDRGRTVTAGTWSLRVTDQGDLEFTKDGVATCAPLEELEQHAAALRVHAQRVVDGAAPALPALRCSVRPFMLVGCVKCGAINTYVEPDTALDADCRCGAVIPAADIARQVVGRRAAAPGYLLTTDVPGGPADLDINARRLLGAVREVAPNAVGEIRAGKLSVELGPQGPAELARIHRVLADRFGVQAETAPGQPATPGTPGTLPQSVMPVPSQGVQSQPGVQPVLRPGAPAMLPGSAPPGSAQGTGSAAQQNLMQQVQPGAVRAGARQAAAVAGSPWLVACAVGTAVHEVPVIATDPAAARTALLGALPGAVVRGVRRAQADLPPADPLAADPLAADPSAGALPPDGGAPPADLSGGGPTLPAIPTDVEDAVRAAMMTFRNSGVDIATGIKDFQNQFKGFLDGYGEEGSPMRQAVGALVVRMAQEAWSKPALLVHASVRAVAADGAGVGGLRIPPVGRPSPAVALPSDAGKVLGPDSSGAEPAVLAPKVKTKPPAASGSNTSWAGHGEETQSAFPTTPKPAKKTPESKGTSYSTPGFGDSPPHEHGTGDNPTTKSWDRTVGKGG